MWWRGVNIKEDTSWAQFVCWLPCCWWKHGGLLYRLFVLFSFHFLISWVSVVCSAHGRLHFILIHRCSSIVRFRIANRSNKGPPMVIEKKKNYGRWTLRPTGNGKTNIFLAAIFPSYNLVCCEFRWFIIGTDVNEMNGEKTCVVSTLFPPTFFVVQFFLLAWMNRPFGGCAIGWAPWKKCVNWVGGFFFIHDAASRNGRGQKFQ